MLNAIPAHMRENRYNPYWREATRQWVFRGTVYPTKAALVAAVEAGDSPA